MLLYYITDRHQFPGDERRQRELLLAKITEAVHCGIDYVQIREHDLAVRVLLSLAHEAVQIVRQSNLGDAASTRRTRLLINSRTDIAIASGADGVHLRSNDIAASEARVIWEKSRLRVSSGEEPHLGGETARRRFLIAVSCHTAAEVRLAEGHGADFAVFAPVFEKVAQPRHEGAGLQALSAACRGEPTAANVEGVATGRMPVLALGGITVENARACIVAGAAGVAGIRLFQENRVADVVRQLRGQAEPRTAGQPFAQRP